MIVSIHLLFELSINDYSKLKGDETSLAKFCNECGNPLVSETAKFCDKCGTNIGEIKKLDQKKVKTGGNPLTVEFILGLIGGIIGFFVGFAVIVIDSLVSAFSAHGGSNAIGLGFGAIIFSLIGIVGAAIVKSKTKIAGYIMIISAIGGLICINVFYILSFILLIIGGIMAVRYKE